MLPKQNHSLTNSLSGTVCLVAILALSGCGGGASATTCDEYAAMDSSGQSDVQSSLLREHDLQETSPDNIAGLSSAIDAFCGSRASALLGGEAESNHDQPLEDAVDWDSETW